MINGIRRRLPAAFAVEIKRPEEGLQRKRVADVSENIGGEAKRARKERR